MEDLEELVAMEDIPVEFSGSARSRLWYRQGFKDGLDGRSWDLEHRVRLENELRELQAAGRLSSGSGGASGERVVIDRITEAYGAGLQAARA